MAKSSREDFDRTRREFQECMSMMSEKIKLASDRHGIDLTGSNFVSRIAQRYGISEKVRKAPSAEQKAPEKIEPEVAQKAEKAAKPAPKAKETKKIALDEVDGL
jgi:hypothetical protein